MNKKTIEGIVQKWKRIFPEETVSIKVTDGVEEVTVFYGEKATVIHLNNTLIYRNNGEYAFYQGDKYTLAKVMSRANGLIERNNTNGNLRKMAIAHMALYKKILALN